LKNLGIKLPNLGLAVFMKKNPEKRKKRPKTVEG
jgi:hypothetical protein